MSKAIIFDLDDTLYDERSFVESGFKAVAGEVERRLGIDKEEFLRLLNEILEQEGRGHVFDTALEHYNLYSQSLVYDLVEVYRSHKPEIEPHPDVVPALQTLRKEGKKLAIITDGIAEVQRNKVRALRIEELFELIIYSDDYGRDYWKPNPFSFQKAVEYFQIQGKEAIYVGDDPSKDFQGANQFGLTTVRIMRGQHKEQKDDITEGNIACHRIDSLSELPELVSRLP